mmetsp:Transcript_22473/g.49799  ORF Transcript_22473/g.49799 Transcript_22473/m.49799 type:complete len:756 (-) Transcript_22473:32-2299(-)
MVAPGDKLSTKGGGPALGSARSSPQGSIGVTPGTDAVPEWMSCDLMVYRVLQDTSAQIASNCKAFSERLKTVCGAAKSQLPQDDSFNTFLTGFGCLSMALLQLSADLDASMSVPLKSLIDTLQEETQGRCKHWRQLRSRMAELQDRHCRSREAASKAKGRLANADETQRGWFRKKDDKEAAIEQHAAMCDLAKCEEELRESEACLKQLESESRERLTQLDNEKRAVLRGALTRGAGTLRRLMVVADKAPPEPADSHSDEWRGIVPGEEFLGPLDADGASSPLTDGCEASGADRASDDFSPGAATPQRLTVPAASPATLPSVESRPQDGSVSSAPNVDTVAAKYMQGGIQELVDVSDDGEPEEEEEEDATSRASNWSPTKSPPVVRTPARRSLVFQSASTGVALRRDADTPGGSRGPKSAEGRWAADILTRSVSDLTNDGTPGASSSELASSFPVTRGESGRMVAQQRSQAVLEDDDDDDDDMMSSKATSATALAPLAAAEVKLEISPLTTEFPHKSFERYVQRLPPRLAFASETSWSKLQARASEQTLGGHVGKLEMFWIHRPNLDPAPETADGMVIFQFVQGFAANFVRILHLSVIGSPCPEQSPGREKGAAPETDWAKLMPSAIFEVRRLLFATLPVASLRAVVLAGEDETGRIYFDRDVEVCYARCRFRWFQLTQSLRRTRSVLNRKEKVKPSSRFLVLHAARGELDPPAPRSSISALPALKLRDEQAAGDTGSPKTLPPKEASAMSAFSNF